MTGCRLRQTHSGQCRYLREAMIHSLRRTAKSTGGALLRPYYCYCYCYCTQTMLRCSLQDLLHPSTGNQIQNQMSLEQPVKQSVQATNGFQLNLCSLSWQQFLFHPPHLHDDSHPYHHHHPHHVSRVAPVVNEYIDPNLADARGYSYP